MAKDKVVVPPYLKKGDLIGVVCPAGKMERKKTDMAVKTLQDWGYRVKLGATVGSKHHYFSGTDEDRLADLQAMMNDPEVRAILCGRGGYGTGRIIDALDFRAFRKKPKWIIGFSDITILHAHLLSKYGIASLHAPMANAFNKGEYRGEYILSLQAALKGRKADYRASCHPFNHPGKAKGMLVGGNLALVTHLIGTPSALDTRGKILFLEDVGEYLYNIDRMMYQLKRAGMLDDLAGLVLGGFTDCKDTEAPFGKTVDELLHDIVKTYRFPICFDFPVSHAKPNYALKSGCTYQLLVTDRKVQLKEE